MIAAGGVQAAGSGQKRFWKGQIKVKLVMFDVRSSKMEKIKHLKIGPLNTYLLMIARI